MSRKKTVMPGLTRASIEQEMLLFKMDCRVKPGNDFRVWS
ncbi:hypothetical protein OCAR_5076 [Afipia carboxidovorans OM5]|nr:hypothetical protein OCAR_5076 [Afipia carboxidovorans OM5]